MKACKTCGNDRGANKRYCSSNCTPGARARTGMTKNCTQCGKDFYATRAQMDRGDGACCSKECSNKYRKDASNALKERTCRVCGKRFRVQSMAAAARGEGKYCSLECTKVGCRGGRAEYELVGRWVTMADLAEIWGVSYRAAHQKQHRLRLPSRKVYRDTAQR